MISEGVYGLIQTSLSLFAKRLWIQISTHGYCLVYRKSFDGISHNLIGKKEICVRLGYLPQGGVGILRGSGLAYRYRNFTKHQGSIMKLSNTNQRKVIVEELKNLNSHPTADELYSIVREKLPNISLGTVYRNLEVLSDAGKLRKLELSGKQKRFDGNTKPHFHKRCPVCDSVEDIDFGILNDVERRLNKLVRKSEITGFNLELTGLCKNCTVKAEEPEEAELVCS